MSQEYNFEELADKCNDLAVLLRDTSRQHLTAWKWLTSEKAREVVDLITILNVESLGKD